jgi:hypothetical protein
MSLTGDNATNDIADADSESATLDGVTANFRPESGSAVKMRSEGENLPQTQDCVVGTSTLADKDTDVVAEDGRLAIKKVGSAFDRNGNLGQFLEDGTSCDARVQTRSTCHYSQARL